MTNQPLHGVNLGGWLILERWMTPSVFDGTSATNEWQLTQTEAGRTAITRHHQSYITEADFEWLASSGVEIVRIPFGHWIFGDVPPYVEGIERLDWAIAMAKKYRLQVLLDMHAAVGAQNSADHAGSGTPHTGERWLKNRQYQRQTIDVLRRITTRYRQENHVWGIQLLNEPARGRFGLRLVYFYRQAYQALRAVARPGTYIVFSDAFSPWLLAGALRSRRNFPVVMDCHVYYCFGSARRRKFSYQLSRVKSWTRRLGWLSRIQPVVVGEWSAILGYPLSDEHRQKFIKQQQLSHRVALATFYWNYKTEGDSAWNYRVMHQRELIAPPTDAVYHRDR